MRYFFKKKINIVVSVILCISILIGTYLIVQKEKRLEKEKIADIKTHYSSTVQMEKGNIFILQDGKYEVIGHVENTIYPSLDDFNIANSNDVYFPILNSNYYVYYQDVQPTEKSFSKTIPEYYLPKKSITTHEVTHFYRDGVLLFSFNEGFTFPSYFSFDNYETVFFFNDFYDIKKEEGKIQEEEIEEATAISIIEFPKMKDDCNSHQCLKTDQLKSFLTKFQEQEFYSLTKEDYEFWIQGQIHLKKKAIFFVSDNTEILKPFFEEMNFKINEKGNWKFEGNNEVSKVSNQLDSLPSYLLSSKTSEEHFLKMVKGESIEKPKTSVSSTSKSLPSKNAKATNIAVLNYHFFYAPGEDCSGGNCMLVSQFREQLNFLKDNQYKTLTIEEYRAWMYGEIELPARSVLITIDDGAKGTGRHNGNKLIPLLEEYDMYATLFLISGWWSKSNYESSHLDIESHTYDMHTEGVCSNQNRGAKMLCSSKEQVMEDLKKSIQMTKTNTAFCFPFYAYNEVTIESIKESGFQLAFIGGSRKSSRSDDKYKIPRYPIYSTTSLHQFIEYIA